MPLGDAELLLRAARWDKEALLGRFTEDPDVSALFREAGVPPPSDASSGRHVLLSTEAPSGFRCHICLQVGAEGGSDPTLGFSVSGLACGHLYCDGCWCEYLVTKVADGDTRISCPHPGCGLAVPGTFVAALCPAGVVAQFQRFLLDAAVPESGTTVWCPTAGCGLAVVLPAEVRRGSLAVACGRGHAFCGGCRGEAHAPATCAAVAAWAEEFKKAEPQYDRVEMKACPGPTCHITIEKNEGCNHMKCRQCLHEFCWQCLQAWAGHGNHFVCSAPKGTADITYALAERKQAAPVRPARASVFCARFEAAAAQHAAAQGGDSPAARRANTEANITRLLTLASGGSPTSSGSDLPAGPDLSDWESRTTPGSLGALALGASDLQCLHDGAECASACLDALKWAVVLEYFARLPVEESEDPHEGASGSLGPGDGLGLAAYGSPGAQRTAFDYALARGSLRAVAARLSRALAREDVELLRPAARLEVLEAAAAGRAILQRFMAAAASLHDESAKMQ